MPNTLYIIIKKTASTTYKGCFFYEFYLAQNEFYGRIKLNIKPTEAVANLGISYEFLHNMSEGTAIYAFGRKEY